MGVYSIIIKYGEKKREKKNKERKKRKQTKRKQNKTGKESTNQSRQSQLLLHYLYNYDIGYSPLSFGDNKTIAIVLRAFYSYITVVHLHMTALVVPLWYKQWFRLRSNTNITVKGLLTAHYGSHFFILGVPDRTMYESIIW